MPHNDPRLPLNCPKCGAPLRYGLSTDGGAETAMPSEVFPAGGDVHHYICLNAACNRCWKLGPVTNLVDDPLRLAAFEGRRH